jgi:hypothetical protein
MGGSWIRHQECSGRGSALHGPLSSVVRRACWPNYAVFRDFSAFATPRDTCHDGAMYFKILGEIRLLETFASGGSIREVARLRKRYGRGHWLKRKGIARVLLDDGSIELAEVHWYEAAGIGKFEFKIKDFL